jgi:hypothetical protein
MMEKYALKMSMALEEKSRFKIKLENGTDRRMRFRVEYFGRLLTLTIEGNTFSCDEVNQSHELLLWVWMPRLGLVQQFVATRRATFAPTARALHLHLARPVVPTWCNSILYGYYRYQNTQANGNFKDFNFAYLYKLVERF